MTAPDPFPTRRLTPSERRLAAYVVKGLNAREIASAAQLKLGTVNSKLHSMRWTLRCPERCSLAVVAHHLLDAEVVIAPTPQRAAPVLSPEQFSLLKAVTTYSQPLYIARAANLVTADLPAALDQLLADTGAQNTTHLVVLAHGWKLLLAEQAHTKRSGASQ
ncbi:LuxR C-terminal-related transcriptional regulator [Streptomyces sp. NPDC048106]|uniref:LuxR C-terminal-related transcriptional regulator n=1 Tax=Streptomyces sp. NPDC048106 TaxID=3155750 RepID=UPI003451AA44